MEAERICLADWEYFGEGGSSTSYINKMNGNIVLKLNRRDIPAATTEKEYLASKAFNEAGLPSPAMWRIRCANASRPSAVPPLSCMAT